MLSVAGNDSLIWIKSRVPPSHPHPSRCAQQPATRRRAPLVAGPARIAPGLLCELELQGAKMDRVAHLGIVERGQAKLVRAAQIVELDVVLAAGHKLAR